MYLSFIAFLFFSSHREPVGSPAADQGGDPTAGGEQRGGGHRRARDDPTPGGHPPRVQR